MLPNAAERVHEFPASTLTRERGFTLVELMVAMAISLILAAAMLTLYVNTTRTNREMAKTNSQIESGRFAVQFLENDIAHVGYWGGYVPKFDDLTQTTAPDDEPTTVPFPCLKYSDWDVAYKRNLIGIPMQAYDTAPPGCDESGDEDGDGDTDHVVRDRQPNTDVLVVRHAETCLPGSTNCSAYDAHKLYFQTPECAGEIAGTTQYFLSDDNNNPAVFTLHKRDCGTVADKRKFISNIYYVRNWAAVAGDGIPTLVRSKFDYDEDDGQTHRPAEALIEGIEGFRVEFGIDNLSETGGDLNDPVFNAPAVEAYDAPVKWADPSNKVTATNRGNGVPDGAFIRCTTATPCTATQLRDAVVARIYLLARNSEATRGYSDNKTYSMGLAGATFDPCAGLSGTALTACKGYKRHQFSTTIRFTNISGRRETP